MPSPGKNPAGALDLFYNVKDDDLHERNNAIPRRQYGKLSFVTSVVFISMKLPARRAWLSASYIRHLIHLYYLALHNGERSANGE